MSDAGLQSRYTILHRLAAGGMAEVYVGEMAATSGVRKQVVIKRILPDLAKDRAFVRMFLDEARVAATLQHPNIVQTHDVVEGTDGYFIAMEYLVGADVRSVGRALSRRKERFPVDIAIQILVGVLAGLHYAHQRVDHVGRPLEIVHRDVSPHNTFVTYDGAVKLLDFGVAKAASNVTRNDDGTIKGKVRYLSPEHCLGAPLDRRADLYSAGGMLYEMLTHARVHHGENPYATMRMIVNDPVVHPCRIRPDLPEELGAILMKALEKKRSRRYATALEMQQALESYCSSAGIFLSPIRLGAWLTDLLPPADRPLGAPAPAPAPAAAPLEDTEHAALSRQGKATVVKLKGKIGERFDGPAIGEQLAGVVVFDLEAVTQMTSFGIRGWLEMLRASRATELYFVRCPEAFLNQASMVRKMLGGGRIVSFYLPFVCPSDQREIKLKVNGDTARRLLEQGIVPDATCPADGAHRPRLDDDLALYQAFRDDFVAQPPRDVAKLDEDGEDAGPEVVKEIDEHGVRVRVSRDLDATTPWRRMLDGLEGHVTLDLHGSVAVDAAGVPKLVSGLERVAEDLRSLRVREAPLEVWREIHASPHLRPLATLVSLQVLGSCEEPMCSAFGVERLGVALAPEKRQRKFEMSPCRACHAELSPSPGQLLAVPGFSAAATPAPAPARREAVPAVTNSTAPTPKPAVELVERPEPSGCLPSWFHRSETP
ncbi:MAG: serine/threonine protein kinase [Alphaproteobacteria bacterium]|nr:serine/threonine protein kinase [Alphaproteobacteria bacterium]